MEQPQSYPLEASAGGDNAYYLDYCDAASHRPGYAVCLGKMKINERDQEQAERRFSQCCAFMKRGNCKAAAMREEEIGAGKALYFISRTSLMTENDKRMAELKGKRTEWGTVKPASQVIKAAKQVAAAKPAPIGLDAGGYVAAVNAGLQAAQAKPALVTLPEFFPAYQLQEPVANGMRSRMPSFN